jgi:intracellular sulfur oxidation DsrE/DsrF family protein
MQFLQFYRGNQEMKYFNVLVIALNLALALTSLAAVAAEAPASKEHLVMQVSDADPGKWNLALNNAKNAQQDYGADKIEIEIVTYGPGIGMLKSDSAVAKRIEEAKQTGISIVACQNTMRGMKLTESDMLPNTSYVPSGVVELVKKQREGYAYVRP